jgi:putative ABC transport system ATP-binding protein
VLREQGGKRARPPELVSPLMLALTTVAAIFCCGKPFFQQGYPAFATLQPYSALSESPSTRMTGLPRWRPGLRRGRPCSRPRAAERGGGQDKVTSIQNQSLSMSQPPSDAIVAVEHVFKSVTDSTGTLDILQDIDFTLGARETAAIVGASGSGKSTLLSIIAGLDTPTRGTVKLAGDDIFAIDEDERAALRAQRVGFVFQSFQLLGNLSALENVMLPLELANRKDARKAATEMLGRVGLGQRLGHYPKVLSGGEQQRVALARAFVVQPALLLADEPTGSLDFATGEQVMKLMFDLNRELGTTLVLVTHDRGIASRCERRITIEAGRVSLNEKDAVATVDSRLKLSK